MNEIDITGVDLRQLIREAYELSVPQGLGFLHYTPGPLDEQAVEDIVTEDRDSIYVDYLLGRAVKLRVRRHPDGSITMPSSWFDHTNEQLRTLLSRVGMSDRYAA